MPSFVDIDPVVLEKKILKFCWCIFAISLLSPLLNKLESPSPKDAFFQVWLRLAQWFVRRFLIKILLMYFRFFVITSPWKRVGPFISGNFNPLYPRMLCAKFDWNKPGGSWEDSNFINIFLLLYCLLLLEKGMALYLNKPQSLLPKDALCKEFGWHWPSGSGEEDENVKNLQTYRWTVGWTTDKKVIRKAQVSYKILIKRHFAAHVTDVYKCACKSYIMNVWENIYSVLWIK